MFTEQLIELKKSKIKQYPVNANRASELGHECMRYLVFQRTRWQDKVLHDVRLQFIFDEGNLHEGSVLRSLQDAGFTVIEQQRSFQWKEFNITGHIDAKIVTDFHSVYPIEIKSCSQFVFAKLETIQDLYNGKYHNLRMYPSQMTLYLLMSNQPVGYFIFKNKTTGELKEIRMELDYELGEKLLKKAESINKHVADDTLPECKYIEGVCDDCGYLHICLPEIKRDSLEIKDDPEIEIKLDRWMDLKPSKSEYEAIDREIKAYFKEREKVVVGDYLILGKWIERKDGNKYWKTTITKLGVNNGKQ